MKKGFEICFGLCVLKEEPMRGTCLHLFSCPLRGREEIDKPLVLVWQLLWDPLLSVFSPNC